MINTNITWKLKMVPGTWLSKYDWAVLWIRNIYHNTLPILSIVQDVTLFEEEKKNHKYDVSLKLQKKIDR